MDLSPNASMPMDLGKLSSLAPELARTFVALSSDIALVIDAGGVIRAVEQGQVEPIAPWANAWIGRSWADTVSADTRGKIEKLLKEATGAGIARRREVNHPLHSGANVPIAYTAIRLGEDGPVLAVGRDMRAIAAIQERFIETQQDMERGYWNARQAQSRARQLLQVANDAVFVVDAETLLVVDANRAAGTLFSSVGERLVGKHATAGFAHASRGVVAALLQTARSSGESAEMHARLLGTVATASVAATSFRAGDAMRLLVRVRAVTNDPRAIEPGIAAGDSASAEDAAAVTDSSGRILIADAGFLALTRTASEDEAKARPFVEWLAALEQPVHGLIPQVRRFGVVASFVAKTRPVIGAGERVDVSASLLTDGDQERIGLTLRRQGTPESAAPVLAPELSADLAQLVEHVGALSLTRLVSEAAALAEKHFIQRALEKSGGDAGAAALLLGVGRDRLVGRDASGARSFDAGADTKDA